MEDKLEEAAKKYADMPEDVSDPMSLSFQSDLGKVFKYHDYQAFKKGAEWQKNNMWISVKEGLPEEGVKNPYTGQIISCIVFCEDNFYQANRVYDEIGDDCICYTWFWEDFIDPLFWMPIPILKEGKKYEKT